RRASAASHDATRGRDPMKILTWLWFQTPNRHGYDADKVNVWAANLRRKSSEPLELAVVTDHPEGIDPSIEIIKPPGLFEDVRIDTWKRSEEHTSELQSRENLVCRLLPEK